MERSQETRVTAPAPPTGASRQPAPAKLDVAAESKPGWHWCPTCKLASGKPGICPGCGTPYVVAPEVGVPDAPHLPKVMADRTRAAVVGSLVAAVALVGAAAASIFLLATHGDGTISGSTAATGSTVDGTSSYGVGVLHGTLRLQGTWGVNMQQVQLPTSVTAGAQVKVALSIGKGSEAIWIGSFPSTDPSTALNQFMSTSPQNSNDAMGNKITLEPSRDVSIAGYTTVAQDFEARNPKGGLLSRGTTYAVNVGDQVVIIRTSASPTQANDLAAIEQALTNIG